MTPSRFAAVIIIVACACGDAAAQGQFPAAVSLITPNGLCPLDGQRWTAPVGDDPTIGTVYSGLVVLVTSGGRGAYPFTFGQGLYLQQFGFQGLQPTTWYCLCPSLQLRLTWPSWDGSASLTIGDVTIQPQSP